MGVREWLLALYFCLAALLERFRHLKPAVILIYAYVGVKLLLLLSGPSYVDDIARRIGVTIAEGMAIKLGTSVFCSALCSGRCW